MSAAKSLNDFYAGALAMFAIILFAKFMTHGRHDGRPAFGWWLAHWACVVVAWIGVISCLIVLGCGVRGARRVAAWPCQRMADHVTGEMTFLDAQGVARGSAC